jgi:hypothetical protein
MREGQASPESQGNKRLPPTSQTAHVSSGSLAEGYEQQAINVRAIVIFALDILVAAIVIHLALWWLLQVWTNRPLTPEM